MQEDDRPTVEDAEPEPELQRKPVLKPRPESINHSGTPPPWQQPGYSAVNQPAMAQQASHPSQAQQQIAQPLAIYQVRFIKHVILPSYLEYQIMSVYEIFYLLMMKPDEFSRFHQ